MTLIARNPDWTRADFYQRVAQIKAQLQADKVSIVALYFEDGALFTCTLLACIRAKVPVLLPQSLWGDNQTWIDEHKALLLNDENIVTYGVTQNVVAETDLALFNNDSLIWLKTSGSSGKAKIIRKTTAQMWQEAQILADTLPFSSSQQLDIVASVSTQHLYGLTFCVFYPLLQGFILNRQPKLFPEFLMAETRQLERCLWVTSPILLNHTQPEKLADIKQHIVGLTCAGGVLYSHIAQGIRAVIDTPLVEIYGSSETGVIAHRQQNHPIWHPFEKTTLGVNEQGALWVESAWSDERQQTADAVEFHANGFELLGRLDRILKFGDKRVSLVQLEQDLSQHPWVKDCYVAPHPEFKRPVAWIALHDSQQCNERKMLVKTFKQYLAPHHERFGLPRFWRFSEHLPRNLQGKISHADFVAICQQKIGNDNG
ncbi:AMP-binding protein [Lonepinella sp. BR2357]|uniref:AMP-binding protein n=1 Tax=Lonepinella sp. BR2357 TaxID=3434549 RepID=UPI003F6DB784